MRPMKQMDITDFAKGQKQLIRKISVMNPYTVIQSILSFYGCPAECGAQCCKLDDIPLILDDKKRISREGVGYRKIIKEGTEIKQISMNGEEITEEVFKDHPCPFLHKDRCSIQRFKPRICALYPFKTTDKVNSRLELVACRCGADILMDFTSFELFMTMMSQDQTGLPQQLSEAAILVHSITEAGTDDLTKTMVYGVNDFEKLRFFLLYLNNEPKAAISARREELKNIVANKLHGC